MKRMLVIFIILLACLYILICGLLYVYQESLIFFPQKLARHYRFNFNQKFHEINITTKDRTILNGLLFLADSARGVIFYLHGNAGSLASWGEAAKTYTDLNYDVFMLDYRGFGKSGGSITNQKQFYEDIQIAYDTIKTRYAENTIVVLGYSIGTGAAARIASTNKPGLLILQAPYYSLSDLVKHIYPVLPSFILKYRFNTYRYITNCTMPVILFHGTLDEVIYYKSSLRLKELFKPTDRLITLHGQSHNGITENPEYRSAIKEILAK